MEKYTTREIVYKLCKCSAMLSQIKGLDDENFEKHVLNTGCILMMLVDPEVKKEEKDFAAIDRVMDMCREFEKKFGEEEQEKEEKQ